MKYRIFRFAVTFPGSPYTEEKEFAAFGETDDESVQAIEARLWRMGLPEGTRLEVREKLLELTERESWHLSRWRSFALACDPTLRDLVAA